MVQQHSRFYCIRSVSTILIPQPIPHPTEIIKIVGVRCTSPDNTLFTPFFITHQNKSNMPKWISVEKAVIKYHIEKEAILLWVEMGQFPMLYIDNVPNVDEECILELFRRSKAGITAEYIDTLEQLCIDKTMVCEKYAHIIQLKEKEIQLQKEINTLINEIQAAMKRQNERIRDLKKAIGENNNVIRSDSWIKRLRKRFQW